MRIMSAAVLTMESLLVGFALLIAKDSATSKELSIGAVIALLFILTAGLLKRRGGYLLGSILQLCLIGYGLVVPQMYFMGGLFLILWIFAIALGRRGEEIKASLIEQRDNKGSKNP